MPDLDLDSLVTSTLWLTGNWAGWVYRRVESLDFVDERTLRRRVSVDFELPPQAVCVEATASSQCFAIPLGLFRKGVLRRFDALDESDRSLPLLTRSQTAEIGARLLVSVAIVALQDAGYDRELEPEVVADLREVAISFDRRAGEDLLDRFWEAERRLIEAEIFVTDEVARRLRWNRGTLAPFTFSALLDESRKRAIAEAVGIDQERIKRGVSDTEVRISIGRQARLTERVIAGALIAMDKNAGPLLDDLASSYLLYVQLAGVPGSRRIVKYAYEHEEGTNLRPALSLLFRMWSALVTGLAGFGVHRVTIPIPNISASGSFHVEVASHDELFISRAKLEVIAPHEFLHSSEAAVAILRADASHSPDAASDIGSISRAKESTHLDGRARQSGSLVGTFEDGPAPLIHLYAGGVKPGSIAALDLELCLDPGGLLPAGLFIAGLIFALLLVGSRFHALGVSRTGDTAAALVIAAAGVFAGYLFRPGEHRLVRRFLRELRLDTTLLTAISFAAAGLLAVAWPHRSDAWSLLTVAAFVLFLRRSAAWLVAESIRRDAKLIWWLIAVVWFLLLIVPRATVYGIRALAKGVSRRRLWPLALGLLASNIVVAAGLDDTVIHGVLSKSVRVEPQLTPHLIAVAIWALSVTAAVGVARHRHDRGAVIAAFFGLSALVAVAADVILFSLLPRRTSGSFATWLALAEAAALAISTGVIWVSGIYNETVIGVDASP
jgi:hypothetical protein